MPRSAEVAPLLQEASGLAESCDIQKQAKMYESRNREAFARKAIAELC